MRINFYDKSFYLFYCFYRKNFGKRELPVLTSIIALAGTTFLQILLVCVIFLRLNTGGTINLALFNRPEVIFSICLFLAVFNILYFIQWKRYYKIILALRTKRDVYQKSFGKYVFLNLMTIVIVISYIYLTSSK